MTMPGHAGPTVLLTGFEPFAEMDYNPSWDVVSELAVAAKGACLHTQVSHPSLQLHTALLPVEFQASSTELRRQISELTPDLVISLGLAAGISCVRLERVGLNLRDARIPDNAGHQPAGEPVVPGASSALFSTARLKAAHSMIAAAGIPVQLSLSAGSFVCNNVLYTLLHSLAANSEAHGSSVPGGFVHLPDLRSPESPLTVAQAVHAVDLLINESLRREADLQAPAGSLH